MAREVRIYAGTNLDYVTPKDGTLFLHINEKELYMYDEAGEQLLCISDIDNSPYDFNSFMDKDWLEVTDINFEVNEVKKSNYEPYIEQ